jgi:hypothetical protein
MTSLRFADCAPLAPSITQHPPYSFAIALGGFAVHRAAPVGCNQPQPFADAEMTLTCRSALGCLEEHARERERGEVICI